MIIKKIEKMSNNKYKIILDDINITTYDSVILENNLLYKKSITKELYDKIVLETKFYDVYNKAVKYIAKKIRCESEIRSYLNSFSLKEDEINKIILKLKDIDLINDRKYCIAYINDRVYLNKEGINKIKNHLINENIDYNIIEEELNKVPHDVLKDNLEKIVCKKIKSNTKYSNKLLKQKIINEVTNLGYNKEDIIEIFNSSINNDNDILNREFNKIYNKLKYKYSGAELNNKVKQKLALKGFSLSEIDLLLTKTEE